MCANSWVATISFHWMNSPMSSRGSGGAAQRLIAGLFEIRPGRSIRDLIWVVDDNVRLSRRREADESLHSRVDRLDVRGDVARPLLQLGRVVKRKVLGLDGAPAQPRAHRELRAGRRRRESRRERRERNKRTGNIPVLLDTPSRSVARPVTSLGLPPARLNSIHQPSRWNDEQRRQKESEQRIQPDQRDIEEAEPNADPQGG